MEDVAIIGMACLFPGAPDLQTYWENIVGKVDATSDPPPEWDADRYFDPHGKANDRTYCKRGGYLKDLARFDPFELGVMPHALDGGEPDHFLSLRIANEALKDAGYTRHTLDTRRTEVIIGRGTYINRGITNMFQHGVVVDQTIDILRELHPETTEEELARIKARLKAKLPPLTTETIASLVPNVLAGRIANRLNLMGTNYIVDAACASSLIAVEQGMGDLASGKCDLAIVGGVNASVPPPILMIFSQIDALSRQQRLRAFDAKADGTLLGEGLGFVILKRRRDAERDGNRIYAHLKGLGVASDGRVHGLLAPWVEGQALAIERAYQAAGISPATVGLIECHGTGVPLGDRTELQSLRRVFGGRAGERPSCAIGTVKSMVGHLLTAAGMAGLIKTALALHHKVLPPTLGCDTPNPELQLEDSPFYVNTETRPWIHGDARTPRQAAINAFGFGGINAHAILEEHVPGAPVRFESLHRRWDSEVFLIRGGSRSALLQRLEQVQQALQRDPGTALADLASTLNTSREPAALCLSVVAESREDLLAKLEHAAGRLRDPACTRIKDRSGLYFFEQPLGSSGQVAFLFPGEGSQYPNMLGDLCRHFPEVRSCFDLLDRAFVQRRRSYLPSHTVFPLPLGADAAAAARRWAMDSAAESVFAANQAMLTLLRRLGIQPQALLGHSTGEYSALLASGMVPADDEAGFVDFVLGVNAVYERLAAEGRIAEGVLLSVGGKDRERLAALVAQSGGALHVAMENCPNQVVLCGTETAVAAAEATLRGEGAVCLRLPFGRAYHTPLFADVCAALAEHFRGLAVRPPDVDVYSCASAARYPGEPDAIRALATSQWAQTVRFGDTIEAMYAAGVRVFIEVGPREHLTAFVGDILRKRPHLALGSNNHLRSGTLQLNHLVGLLAAHHVPLDPTVLYEHRAPRQVPLGERAAEKTGEGGGRDMRIATTLPRLHLQREPAAASPAAPAASRPAGEPVTPTPRPPVAPGKPAAATVHASASPAAPPARTHAAGGDRAGVVAAYLRTMEGFLASNEAVLRARLAQRGAPGRAPEAGTRAASNGGTAHAPPTSAAAPNGQSAAHGPFIRQLVASEPGRAVALCTLDLRQDRFLADHTLGGRVSRQDGTLLALPILPLTFSMELLCEGGALLVPGGTLVGMKEVRAYRWIALGLQRPTTLQIVATRLAGGPADGNGQVKVQIRELPPGVDPLVVEPGLPLVEAQVLFGDARPPAPPAPDFQLDGRRPSRWTGVDLYEGFMFHGPSLRSVASMDAWGQNGAQATLRAMPDEPLFDGGPRADFALDPVVLDGAGQVVAYWTSDHLPRGYHVFPFRVEEVQVFGPRFRAPETTRCQARVVLEGEELTRSDIDLVDQDGRVRYRLLGWWDRRFEMPERFARFLARPAETMLSSAWPDLPPPLVAVNASACIFDAVDAEFLAVHDRLWERVLAHIVLSRAERQEWAALAGKDKRRLDWLFGRVAAKDAVRLLLKGRRGLDVCPADIEVTHDAQGKPLVTSVAGLPTGERPEISIAHSAGVAVAIAAEREQGRGLGVDVESPRAMSPSLQRGAFSDDERRLLSSFGEAEEAERMLSAWCAKEAFAKALGTGFKGLPTNVEIKAFDPAARRFEVQVARGLSEARADSAGLPTAVHALRLDDHVIAACICETS